MHGNPWRCLARAVLIAAGLVVAGTAAAQTPAAQAPTAPVSATQAQDLVNLLNDPARRNQLIGALQALEKLTPTAAPASAPAAKAAAPAPPTVVAHTVTSSGLVSQIVRAAPSWATGVFGQFASLRRLLVGIPASWQWLSQTATDEASRDYLAHVGLGLIEVIGPAALAWFALRWLLRPRRRRIGALAARADPGAEAVARKPPVAQRLRGSARLLSLAVLAFVLDIAPVAAFGAVGYVLTPTLTEPGPPQVLVLGVVDSFALFAAVLAVARLAFAPDIPALRLVPMSDAAAIAVVRWVAWLQGIAVFGTTILHTALLLGLDPGAELALQKLLLLVDHVLLVAIVLRYRQPVAAHLRSPKRRSGVFANVLTGLSEVWHIVAVFLIMGLWLIWAADWQGGYTRLLRFALTAIAIGIICRLVTAGLLILLRQALGIAEAGGGFDHPMAYTMATRPRVARYYPILHAGISTIISIIGVVVLLELSGVSSIGWLLGSALGWQVCSAFISIALTLCLGVAAWEGTNIALERHLDRLSRQAQRARATRLRTLQPMLRTAIAIGILILVVLTTLSQIGVNIAPLLAGAGIVGVAIGFGSQKLVQDLITGLFLLLEDAMQVGDFVTLAGVSGTVETLSIRTIRLRAGDGSIHIIPFSSVTMVNNTNRGLGNAAVSVTIAAHEDPDAVGEVLKAIVLEMRQDEAFKPMILSDLQLWGVDQVNGVSVVLAGQIVCTDAGRWGVQREFNRRYRKRFLELGIEIPTPTQTLLLRQAPTIRPRPSAPDDAGETTATVTASPPSSALGHAE